MVFEQSAQLTKKKKSKDVLLLYNIIPSDAVQFSIAAIENYRNQRSYKHFTITLSSTPNRKLLLSVYTGRKRHGLYNILCESKMFFYCLRDVPISSVHYIRIIDIVCELAYFIVYLYYVYVFIYAGPDLRGLIISTNDKAQISLHII